MAHLALSAGVSALTDDGGGGGGGEETAKNASPEPAGGQEPAPAPKGADEIWKEFKDWMRGGMEKMRGAKETQFQEVTAEDTEKGSISAGIIAFFRAIGRIFIKIIKNYMPIIKFLLAFGLTIGVLIICLIIGYVFYRYFHPRVCLINRNAAFEAYMDIFLEDVANAIFEMPQLMRKRSVQLLFRVNSHDRSELQRACAPGLQQNKVPDEAKRSSWGSPGGNCVLENQERELNRVLPILMNRQSDELEEELRIYYKFNFTIKHLRTFLLGYFAQQDILNEPRFEKKDSGIYSRKAVQEFKDNIMDPYDDLSETVKDMSKELATWEGMYHQEWFDEDCVRFITHIHTLNLMLNEYRDQIIHSYNTRKATSFTMQFNIWVLYWVPYIKDVFLYRIPAVWIAFPRHFAMMWNGVIDGWAAMVRQIRLVPCRVILFGSKYRAEDVCSFLADMEIGTGDYVKIEAFQNDDGGVEKKDEKQKNKVDGGEVEEKYGEEEGDVREGFGFLIPLIMVGKFFGIIIILALVLARMIVLFMKNPFKAIIFPFFVSIGLGVGLPLLIIELIITMLHVHLILALVLGFVFALVYAVLLTLFEVMWAAFITVAFVLLWVLDLLTGGMVVKLMRCENLPNEWETRPNYGYGNLTERTFGTACCRPCPPRFRPFFVFCLRLPDHIPDFCPHQQILRTFKTGAPFGNSAVNGPAVFDRYPSTALGMARFRQLSRREKRQKILDAFEDGRQFYTNCFFRLKKYDYINRHICSSIDKLPDKDYPEDTKNQLRHICHLTYCRYRPDKVGRFRTRTVMRAPPEKSSSCMCIAFEKWRREHGKEVGEASGLAQTGGVSKAIGSLSFRILLLIIGMVILISAVYSLFVVGNKLHLNRHEGLSNPLPGARNMDKRNLNSGLMSELKF